MRLFSNLNPTLIRDIISVCVRLRITGKEVVFRVNAILKGGHTASTGYSGQERLLAQVRQAKPSFRKGAKR